MKKYGMAISTIATVALLGMYSSVGAEPVYRYNGDSEYATVSTNGFKRVYLRVDRVKVNSSAATGTTHVTKLYYTTFDPNIGYRYWSGEIGNGDFSGASPSKMMLNTNTCDYNPTNFCGVVSMTWSNDGSDSTRSSGIVRTETNNYIMHQSGSSNYAIANVSGTILGINVNVSDSIGSLFGYGRMGSDRSATLTISNK